MGQFDDESESDILTKPKASKKLDKPKQYKVLLHNDDYTTQEFVVWVLMSVFGKSGADATQIMLHVHRNGVGVAGIYSREVAETRVAQVHDLAREHEHPLRCTMEEA